MLEVHPPRSTRWPYRLAAVAIPLGVWLTGWYVALGGLGPAPADLPPFERWPVTPAGERRPIAEELIESGQLVGMSPGRGPPSAGASERRTLSGAATRVARRGHQESGVGLRPVRRPRVPGGQTHRRCRDGSRHLGQPSLAHERGGRRVG
jgi:hypothetical protein